MAKNNITLTNAQINEILQAQDELLKIAEKYNIPMFSAVMISNSKADTKYNSVAYSPESNNIEVYDDKIKKLEKIMAGFDAVPKRENITIDMDDLF